MGRIEEIRSKREELQSKLRDLEREERDLTSKEVLGKDFIGKYIKAGTGGYVYVRYLKVSTQDIVVDPNNGVSSLVLRGPGFSSFHTVKQTTYAFDSDLTVNLIKDNPKVLQASAENELIEITKEEFKKELDKAIMSSISIFKFLEN